MHTAEEQAWGSNDLLEEVTVANVADLRTVRRQCAVSIVVRHPDIPEGVSFGTYYVEGPLRRVLETLATSVPELFSSLEAGVPETRRAALPLDSFRRAIFGAPMGGESVVSDCPEQR
jgi:hypothetical protein